MMVKMESSERGWWKNREREERGGDDDVQNRVEKQDLAFDCKNHFHLVLVEWGRGKGKRGRINAEAEKRSSRQLIDVFHSISLHPMKTVTRFLTFFLTIFAVQWILAWSWQMKGGEWKLWSVRWITSGKKKGQKRFPLTDPRSLQSSSNFLFSLVSNCSSL